jgi:uncharacterized protein
VSIEQHIVILERLAAIDANIKDLTESIGKRQGELSSVNTEMASLDTRLDGDKSSIAEMERVRNDLVAELRQIAQQIERSRERMQRARNERESNAAERELDELRKIQRDRDEEIKKLQILSDQARGSITVGQARRQELTDQLSGSLGGNAQNIVDLDGELAAKRAQRAEVGKQLPSIIFRRYERLMTRGRVPIAKTHDGTCLGCFVKLPPMMFHTMLSRQQFEECPNCHRIIYYAPPPTADDGEPAGDAAEAVADPVSSS